MFHISRPVRYLGSPGCFVELASAVVTSNTTCFGGDFPPSYPGLPCETDAAVIVPFALLSSERVLDLTSTPQQPALLPGH